ncbi:MAG: FAD-dependent oxidoreductase, partial [Planctomycetota bacterium]
MHSAYDVIVIGGGHAGTEAAWAAAAALGDGARVALVTMDPSRIGQMSCNPAIGGLAKGQMVREIVFKMLNTSKGAAVHGPRAQADKYAYAAEVQRLLASRDGIDVIAGTIDELIVEDRRVAGVVLPAGAGVVRPAPVYAAVPDDTDRIDEPRAIRCDAVVLTTGTFMRGLMHTGDVQEPGGRVGEGSAVGISGMLRDLGFELGRLKTGTPPRLARETIAWDDLDPQVGDETPRPFSDMTPALMPGARFPVLEQVDCRITRTCAEAHAIIRDNLHRAPMYSGQVEADAGPRYCPSIEDKVVRF